MGFDTLDLARTVVSNSFIRIMKLDKFDPLRNIQLYKQYDNTLIEADIERLHKMIYGLVMTCESQSNTHTQSQKRVSAECL